MTAKNTVEKTLFGGALALALCAPIAAQENAGIVGQDGWLYYRYDFTDASEQPSVERSIALFSALSSLLEANGTQMVLAVIPAKVRIYPQYLPPERALTPFLQGHYRNSIDALLAQGVDVVDLGTAFEQAAAKPDDDPVFMKLDSHWSQTGALLAAETIATHVRGRPDTAGPIGALPERGFGLAWNPQRQTLGLGDLTSILPPGSPTFAPEQARVFQVSTPEGGDLLGDDGTPGIALMGSSFSGTWTGFPDALRYALQRDVASLSVAADRGHWVGMGLYLSDDGFQSQPPKVLVMEIPERGLAAPPSYPYREARYVIDERQWLRRAAALITRDCSAAGSISATDVPTALALAVDGDAFLAANLAVKGPNSITLNWQAEDGHSLEQTIEFQGDGAWHALRVPMPESLQPVAVRLESDGAELILLEEAALCRMPTLPAISG